MIFPPPDGGLVPRASDTNFANWHELEKTGRGNSRDARRECGLQPLTVKSRLLPGENTVRIRGGPPVSNAPVAQLPERDASNLGDVGEIPSGSATFLYDFRFTILDLTACGLPRTVERPVSETVSRCNSSHADHFSKSAMGILKLQIPMPT